MDFSTISCRASLDLEEELIRDAVFDQEARNPMSRRAKNNNMLMHACRRYDTMTYNQSIASHLLSMNPSYAYTSNIRINLVIHVLTKPAFRKSISLPRQNSIAEIKRQAVIRTTTHSAVRKVAILAHAGIKDVHHRIPRCDVLGNLQHACVHLVHAEVHILRREGGDGIETLLWTTSGGEFGATGVHVWDKGKKESIKKMDRYKM